MVLGPAEFIFADQVVLHVADFVPNGIDYLAGSFYACPGIDADASRIAEKVEFRVDGVNESLLFPNILEQAGLMPPPRTVFST